MSRLRRFTLAGLALLGVASSFAAPAVAQSEPTVTYVGEPPELWEGPWTGMLFAFGDGVFDSSAVSFIYELDFTGSFALESADEEIEGTFEMLGDYRMDGNNPGGDFFGDFVGDGVGDIVGTATEPKLVGIMGGEGALTLIAGGETRVVPAQPSFSAIEFDIELEVAMCLEVYGSFRGQLETGLEAEGWIPTVQGNFIALQDERIVQQSIEEWRSGWKGNQFDLSDQPEYPAYLPDVAKAMDQLLRRFNSWADRINAGDISTDDALWDDTVDLLHDLDDFNARLRNLSDCEIAMLGDLASVFVSRTTQGMLYLVERLAPTLSAEGLYVVTTMAANAGALGSGSVAPELAARVEAALKAAAEELIAEFIDPDDPDCPKGCLLVTDESWQLLTLGYEMKWVYMAKGKIADPVKMLQQAGMTTVQELDLIDA